MCDLLASALQTAEIVGVSLTLFGSLYSVYWSHDQMNTIFKQFRINSNSICISYESFWKHMKSCGALCP